MLEFVLIMLLGVTWGLLFGIIPTAGPTTALVTSALFLPYFETNPLLGVAFYVAIVAACSTGDTWTSILLGIPGSSSSTATVMDGYPLAKQGKAAYALSAAFTSSTLNGLLWGIIIFAGLPFYGKIALYLGIPEIWALTIFAFCTIIFLVGNNIIKGIVALIIGLILGVVGVDVNYVPRLTGGWIYLESGIPIIIFAAGLFAIPEIIETWQKNNISEKVKKEDLVQQTIDGIKDTFKNIITSLYGGIIGAVIGALPGLHGIVADWLAYTQAKIRHKSEVFGKGNIKGVIGAEGANNSVSASSFIPTTLFGIPGTPFAAIILVLFFQLDFELGSISLLENFNFFLVLGSSFVLSTLFVGLICLFLSRWIAVLCYIPFKSYAPLLIVLIMWSCYQYTYTYNDILLLFFSSILGIIAKKIELERSIIILGFILSSKFEELTYQLIAIYTLKDLIYRIEFIVILIIIASVIFYGLKMHYERKENE